jgi:formylglycine-generating enzyme required for sulfatase activity
MKARFSLVLTLIGLSFVLSLGWPLVEAQNQRRPEQKSSGLISILPGQTKRWALIVGVDQYRDSQISRLRGAGNDAKMLAEALTRYAGFPADQVILLATDQPEERQPTRVNILRRLSNLASVVPKDGLLLVSFAGHGMELEGRAYLLPTDAQLSNDITLVEETALSVIRMKDRIRAIGVQQVIVLLDACRNDPVGRGIGGNRMSAAYKFDFDLRNREVTAFATLYATAVGQLAYEFSEKRQGYFTWAIVEALKGAAANAQGEVTLAALLKYVQEAVPKRVGIDLGAGKEQKPFAEIEGYLAEGLVITYVPKPIQSINVPLIVPSLVNSVSTESQDWQKVRGSNDPEQFREFLKKYPNGDFADAAKGRLDTLSVLNGKKEPAPIPPALRVAPEIEMVYVAGGTFLMGSPNEESDRIGNEGPQHRVTVPSYYIGKYEITQVQWKAVMGYNHSRSQGEDLPVSNVSWDEAKEFCRKLSQMTGKQYRLPTEAEWEYACRAGTTKPHAGDLGSIAWYMKNSDLKTHPIGQKKPNAFGLYDMHGNVYEWCEDVWHKSYVGAPIDGSAWLNGGDSTYRVKRGGSWGTSSGLTRSAVREGVGPGDPVGSIGLRVVMSARPQ